MMEQTFRISKDAVMMQAIEVLSILGKDKEITIVATGDSIPNAVAVSNIILNNLLKNNSKIQQISVDSEAISQMGQAVSNIKIVLRQLK